MGMGMGMGMIDRDLGDVVPIKGTRLCFFIDGDRP
jgi:hypothetical protein